MSHYFPNSFHHWLDTLPPFLLVRPCDHHFCLDVPFSDETMCSYFPEILRKVGGIVFLGHGKVLVLMAAMWADSFVPSAVARSYTWFSQSLKFS